MCRDMIALLGCQGSTTTATSTMGSKWKFERVQVQVNECMFLTPPHPQEIWSSDNFLEARAAGGYGRLQARARLSSSISRASPDARPSSIEKVETACICVSQSASTRSSPPIPWHSLRGLSSINLA